MKNAILTSAILLATAAVSFAQSPSDNATLNVNLTSVKTIEVLSPTVDINVVTAADYVAAATAAGTGVFTEEASHLKVVSTGAFKVTASSTTDLIGQTLATESISKSNIYLLASNAVTPVGKATLGLAAPTEHSLASNSALIETTGGTPGTTFNVKYTLRGQDDIANLSDQTYTTTVVYTLEDK